METSSGGPTGASLVNKSGRGRHAVGQGRRTGVRFASRDVRVRKDGMEDIDEFFGGARSPPKAAPGDIVEKKKKYSVVKESAKKNNKKKRKEPRFSLMGEQGTDASDDSKMAAYVQRVLTKQGCSINPAELSSVSTAPPSVDVSRLSHEGKESLDAFQYPVDDDQPPVDDEMFPASSPERDNISVDSHGEKDLTPPPPPPPPLPESPEYEKPAEEEEEVGPVSTPKDADEVPLLEEEQPAVASPADASQDPNSENDEGPTPLPDTHEFSVEEEDELSPTTGAEGAKEHSAEEERTPLPAEDSAAIEAYGDEEEPPVPTRDLAGNKEDSENGEEASKPAEDSSSKEESEEGKESPLPAADSAAKEYSDDEEESTSKEESEKVKASPLPAADSAAKEYSDEEEESPVPADDLAAGEESDEEERPVPSGGSAAKDPEKGNFPGPPPDAYEPSVENQQEVLAGTSPADSLKQAAAGKGGAEDEVKGPAPPPGADELTGEDQKENLTVAVTASPTDSTKKSVAEGKGEGANEDEDEDPVNLPDTDEFSDDDGLADPSPANSSKIRSAETRSPNRSRAEADESHVDEDNDEVGCLESPESVRGNRQKNKKQKHKIRKGKKGEPATPSSIMNSNKRKKGQVEDDATIKSTRRTSKRKKKSVTFSPKGIQSGPLEFRSIPVSQMKEPPAKGEENLRRSSRARIQPLAWWRGERMIYGPNDMGPEVSESLKNMPVPKAVSMAEPTPYKKRKVVVKRTPRRGRPSKSDKQVASRQPAELVRFDESCLKYDYIDGESAVLWDECIEEATELKVISKKDSLLQRDLPINKPRKRSEGNVVGRAAQAFNVLNDENPSYCGYLMGNLSLPPGGIKDAESVGTCSQLFTVVSGQPNALEVAYGDPLDDSKTLAPATAKRFLLGPGDIFRIPPGNSYRLENHSQEAETFLTWAIIRAVALPEGDTMAYDSRG